MLQTRFAYHSRASCRCICSTMMHTRILLRVAVAEWLSSWLAEQEVRGSILGLATRILKIGYLLLPSRDMAEILLKRRKFSIQPTNKKSSISSCSCIYEVQSETVMNVSYSDLFYIKTQTDYHYCVIMNVCMSQGTGNEPWLTVLSWLWRAIDLVCFPGFYFALRRNISVISRLGARIKPIWSDIGVNSSKTCTWIGDLLTEYLTATPCQHQACYVFEPIFQLQWPSGPLIGWDNFYFFFATNMAKFYMEHVLNIRIFRSMRQSRWLHRPLIDWSIFDFYQPLHGIWRNLIENK